LSWHYYIDHAAADDAMLASVMNGYLLSGIGQQAGINPAGTNIESSPVRIVQVGNTNTFGRGGINKHAVIQVETHMGDNLCFIGPEKNQITFRQILL
jgi:hypothetical protein